MTDRGPTLTAWAAQADLLAGQHGGGLEVEVLLTAHVDRDAEQLAARERERVGVLAADGVRPVVPDAQAVAAEGELAELGQLPLVGIEGALAADRAWMAAAFQPSFQMPRVPSMA